MQRDETNPPPTRVLLVRHGQTTWNAEGRWQGHEDPPLSELGEAQAIEAAGNVGPIDAVWSSDLVRARRTAEVIAEPRGLQVRVDPRFRERDGGPWQGLTRAEIEARWPGHLKDGRRPEGYEAWQTAVTRIFAALADLAAEHPRQTVLVLTHGGIVRAAERHLEDLTRGDEADRIPNLGGRSLYLNGSGGWRLGEPIILLSSGSITVPGQL
jgi:probable phosphoglycerate mutase